MPRMHPVDSSSIAAIGYDFDARKLHLRFRASGLCYVYFGVAPEVAEALMRADSKGAYFNAHVRDRYPCDVL